MFNFIKKLFKSVPPYNGVQPDTRPESEKAKDWLSIEVASTAETKPIFRTVQDFQWKKYTVRNQDGSGSCVANTIAKMLEVKRYLSKGDSVKFSHAPIYIKRINRPSSGMVGTDALDLAIKFSSCKESEMPSENMSDKQLDSLSLPANFEDLNNLVNPKNRVLLPMDFDYVAAMVEKEGCAMIWVNTDYASWCKDIPTAGGKKGSVVHSICAVDAITLNGVQYIVIEDSWGKFGKYDGQRLITREFFNDAVWFGGLLLDFTYNVVTFPFENFNVPMTYGETNNEVKRLQDYLKSKGLMPSNIQSTGYYGNITAKAVYAFQIRYNVAPLSELDFLKGKRVGQKTLNKINEVR